MELVARFIKSIIDFGHMIKFSHSIFALPFALASVVWLWPNNPVTLKQLIWILIAMVSARSAAMGFNRLVDRKIDARNPRTRDRHLPAGTLSAAAVSVFIIVSVILFILSAAQLNRLCLYLSPVALAVLLGYSFTKRFTSFSHLILGLALGISPVGSWLAVSGYFSWLPVILGIGVMFWVAGFDVLYALQDVEYDRKHHLFSIPVWLGEKRAVILARWLHLITICCLISVGVLGKASWIHWLGLTIIIALLIKEHRIVSPEDLSRLDLAFFNMNGIIAVLYFVTVLLDTVVNR